MNVILLTFVLALAMGCVAPAPLPAATPVPFLARQLDVRIYPKEAASYLLNPSPLGKGGYSLGMIVTIDILPQPGWQVDKWIGPVFNVDGTTAKIGMKSSHTVGIRMQRKVPVVAITSMTQPPTNTVITKPTNIPLSTSTATDLSHYGKGYKYFLDGKYDQAIREFTNAIRLDPGSARAFEARCTAYFEMHDYKKALDDCNKAVLLRPNVCCAHYVRGNIYGFFGEYSKAIEDFGEAIRIDPLYAAAYESRSESYRSLGESRKANADTTKACSLDGHFC